MILSVITILSSVALGQVAPQQPADSLRSPQKVNAGTLPRYTHALEVGGYRGKFIGIQKGIAGYKKIRGDLDLVVTQLENTEKLIAILVAKGGFGAWLEEVTSGKVSEANNRRVVVYELEPQINPEITQEVSAYNMYPYSLDAVTVVGPNKNLETRYTGGVATTQHPALVLNVNKTSKDKTSITMVTANSGNQFGGSYSIKIDKKSDSYYQIDPNGGAIKIGRSVVGGGEIGNFTFQGTHLKDGTRNGRIQSYGSKIISEGQALVTEVKPSIFTVGFVSAMNFGNVVSKPAQYFLVILGHRGNQIGLLINPLEPCSFETLRINKN